MDSDSYARCGMMLWDGEGVRMDKMLGMERVKGAI